MVDVRRLHDRRIGCTEVLRLMYVVPDGAMWWLRRSGDIDILGDAMVRLSGCHAEPLAAMGECPASQTNKITVGRHELRLWQAEMGKLISGLVPDPDLCGNAADGAGPRHELPGFPLGRAEELELELAGQRQHIRHPAQHGWRRSLRGKPEAHPGPYGGALTTSCESWLFWHEPRERHRHHRARAATLATDAKGPRAWQGCA